MNENIMVGLIVVIAVAYLLRKLVFKKKGSSGSPCDGCGRCGGSKGGCH